MVAGRAEREGGLQRSEKRIICEWRGNLYDEDWAELLATTILYGYEIYPGEHGNIIIEGLWRGI